jgi:DNA processing protein
MVEHGSAGAALDALPDVARQSGETEYTICPEGVAAAEMKAARLTGARPVAWGSLAYPPLLAQIPDAPPLLWALGDIALLQRPMLAVVGARNASSLGTRMARALASGLGEAGQVVVSGLARGVDAVAHQAALPTGTVAVLAGGVDVVYPAENASLAQEIAEAGLRLSEQPLGLVPQARHFPRRNRIVSGLCRAVIVVEAAAKSGSLTTARFALDQGREVMAVPGHPFDSRASGCNMLIRDGAMLVRSAQDVVQALDHVGGPAAQPLTEPAVEPRKLADMSALHRQILDRLGPSPLAEDQLIRDLQIPAGEVGPELLNLELEGRIERRAGGLLSLRVN